MTHVTCRLTAKNRDQLRDPTLGNYRLWATFTFLVTLNLGGTFVEFRAVKANSTVISNDDDDNNNNKAFNRTLLSCALSCTDVGTYIYVHSCS